MQNNYKNYVVMIYLYYLVIYRERKRFSIDG